jgi:glycosyltransferase involved in cell wall biosynthesis
MNSSRARSPAHKDVAIVIAAYNEEKRVGKTVRDVIRAGWPWVIVVDDGSRDSTVLVAKKAGAQVLVQKQNQGQGAALRRGIKQAVKDGAVAVVTYDADGQFVASEIARVAQPVLRGDVDVVLGSRFKGRAIRVTQRKKIMLRFAILFTRLISRVQVTDTHNGFRCLSRDAARAIRITFDRMEHASEILDEVHQLRLSYTEVPITIIYHEEGQHPLRAVTMGSRLLWWKLTGY